MKSHKRQLSFLCSFIFLAIAIVCAGGCGNSEKVPYVEKTPQHYQYSLQTYLTPFWKGNVCYNETACFLGKNAKVKLLYEAEQIVSVRSYDLKTEYFENVDFVYKNGELSLTSNTNMPYFTEQEYFVDNGTSFPCNLSGHKKMIHIGDGEGITSKQVVITYTHKKSNKYAPKNSVDTEKIMERLSKEGCNILFFGDSIMVGRGSSQYQNISPNMPTFENLVKEYLSSNINESINTSNASVGGKGSKWGSEQIESVLDKDFDIAVVGFGMNDEKRSKSQFAKYMQNIVDQIHAKNPNTYIILVSSMQPNQWWRANSKQLDFEKKLESIASKDKNVGVVNITSLFRLILERKNFYEISHNNINHPNDFLERVYAQSLLFAMLGDGYVNNFQ